MAILPTADRLRYLPPPPEIGSNDYWKRAFDSLEKPSKELARWTSPIDHNSMHIDLINNALPDTGLWLRKYSEFHRWAHCNFSSVLVLHGIPGCGKTMLTSVLIEQHLIEQRVSIDTPPFAYFYCGRSETGRGGNQAAEVLQSIVQQIAISTHSESTRLDVLMFEYEAKKSQICGHNDIPSLTSKDCERIILAIAAKETVTIIIDAIDEIEITARQDLQDSLMRIYTAQNHRVKIFLSMQNDAQMLLPPPLANDYSVKMTDNDTRHDVARFTELSLSRISLPTMTLQLKSELVDILVEEAKGM